VEVSIPGDALPLDDTGGLVVDVPRDVRALIVDGAPSPVKYRDEAYFVESALSSAASPVRTHLVDGEALATEDLAQYDVVFLLNVRSVGGRSAALQRYVLDGGGLFVSMGDQVDPDLYARELGGVLPMTLHAEKSVGVRGEVGGGGAARFAEVDFDHPALSVFTGEAREGLLGTRFFRYLLAGPGRGGAEPSRVLAAFDDGAPALVEARRGRGRVLLFTSSMDRTWTDWPIRTSFLPAVQRLTGWLAGVLDEKGLEQAQVGQAKNLEPPQGVTNLGVVGPDGKPVAVSLTPEKKLVAGPLKLPGAYQVSTANGSVTPLPDLTFAVNVDPRESDLARLDERELKVYFGERTRTQKGGGKDEAPPPFPLWSMLLAFAAALLVTEGTLLRK
jgi:hypothetical protein